MNTTKYTSRYIARVVMEAKTPLSVGSGDKDITTDALVALDVNGLPYIPGTAIAGILRHAVGEKDAELFFGKQSSNSADSRGSEIIFTEAKMVGADGKVIDGLKPNLTGEFYEKYKELPIRQHAKINEFGSTVKGGKFDEQVVFKGTRFCFEIEMVSDGKNVDVFLNVLKKLRSKSLRFGGGTRCGFGEMEIVSCKYKIIDLRNQENLNFYMEKSSSLENEWEGTDSFEIDESNNWISYELNLKPKDFFLFGSGFGDDEVDMTPVKEDIVVWKNEKPLFVENNILIPATSIKGALSHRTAFYYNMLKKRFADDKSNGEPMVGSNNEAVRALFGYESQDEKEQVRGNVIFSDIIENKKVEDKILNHASIDRFTGGTIDGALFSEKTTLIIDDDKSFTTTIFVNEEECMEDSDIIGAFELALKDLCNGMLPLGGGVNRGNGCFSDPNKKSKGEK